jgi:hypothetical protein
MAMALTFFAWLPTYLVRARNLTEKELFFSAWLFLFGASANVASGLTSDFRLRRVGPKAARCRIGMIGFACAALFVFLAAVTPVEVWDPPAALLDLCRNLLHSAHDLPDVHRGREKVSRFYGWRAEHYQPTRLFSFWCLVRLFRKNLRQL